MNSLWNHIAAIFQINRRRRVYDQLQWQRFLLRTGVPATAQVLDMVQVKSEMLEYVQVHFWVMLRLKGNITYRHIETLLNKKDIPAVGKPSIYASARMICQRSLSFRNLRFNLIFIRFA